MIEATEVRGDRGGLGLWFKVCSKILSNIEIFFYPFYILRNYDIIKGALFWEGASSISE